MHTLLLHPFPQYLKFGGDALKRAKAWRPEDLRDGPLAEVWEISDHRLHSSVVRVGPEAGRSLAELLERDRVALLGQHANLEDKRFPLMIRLLDVREDLVPAIHPGPGGSPDGAKYEAGVVLARDAGAKIYSGLREGVDAERMLAMALEGRSFETMDAWEVQPGECYYVPAGKLHAWGTGNLLYEVHTISNAIFALDWMAWDKDEARRQSDRDGVVRYLDADARGSGLCPSRRLATDEGMIVEEICRNEHFVLERLTLSEPIPLDIEDDRFYLYTLIQGAGRLDTLGENLRAYDTFLVPAESEPERFTPSGPCIFLRAYLP